MIKVNGKSVLCQDGTTIRSLLKLLETDKRFSYMLNFKGMIFYGGELIVENMYESTLVRDGDDIRIIPLVIGG